MDQVLFDLELGLCEITTTHCFRTSIGYPSTSNAHISKSIEDINIIFSVFCLYSNTVFRTSNSQLHCDSEMLAAATYNNLLFLRKSVP